MLIFIVHVCGDKRSIVPLINYWCDRAVIASWVPAGHVRACACRTCNLFCPSCWHLLPARCSMSWSRNSSPKPHRASTATWAQWVLPLALCSWWCWTSFWASNQRALRGCHDFYHDFLSRILGIKEFSYSCHCSRSVVSTSRFSQIKNLSKSVDICVLNSAWQQSFTLNTLSTQNDRFMSLLSDNLCVNIFAISLRFGWRCATLVTSLIKN